MKNHKLSVSTVDNMQSEYPGTIEQRQKALQDFEKVLAVTKEDEFIWLGKYMYKTILPCLKEYKKISRKKVLLPEKTIGVCKKSFDFLEEHYSGKETLNISIESIELHHETLAYIYKKYFKKRGYFQVKLQGALRGYKYRKNIEDKISATKAPSKNKIYIDQLKSIKLNPPQIKKIEDKMGEYGYADFSLFFDDLLENTKLHKKSEN